MRNLSAILRIGQILTKISYLFSLACIVVGCTSAKMSTKTDSDAYGNVELIFSLKINNKPFKNDSIYYFQHGEQFSLKKLSFFVSHLAFSTSVGKEVVPLCASSASGVYLLDLTSEKNAITLKIKSGEYSDLRFDLGVPRELNHSEPMAQKFPLRLEDSGMFWEWSSGYIFFLAEGFCPKLKGERFHFAIGGDTRIMPFAFGNLFDVKPKINIKPNEIVRVYLEFDFDEILKKSTGELYLVSSAGSFLVHGGDNADELRNNILKSIKMTKIE